MCDGRYEDRHSIKEVKGFLDYGLDLPKDARTPGIPHISSGASRPRDATPDQKDDVLGHNVDNRVEKDSTSKRLLLPHRVQCLALRIRLY